MSQFPEDPLARTQREWRDYCRRLPGYRPHTEAEMERAQKHWAKRAAERLAASEARPARRRRRGETPRDSGIWGT